MECEYCKRSFSSVKSLTAHQRTAKVCLRAQQDNSHETNASTLAKACRGCGRSIIRMDALRNHEKRCSAVLHMENLTNKHAKERSDLVSQIEERDKEIIRMAASLEEKRVEINKLRQRIRTDQTSINPLPYYDKDVVYIGAFEPDRDTMEVDELRSYFKFGRTSNYEERDKQHKALLTQFKLAYALPCRNGQHATRIEKRLKQMVKEKGLNVRYKSHQEIFFADAKEWNALRGDLDLMNSDVDECDDARSSQEMQSVSHEIEIRLRDTELRMRDTELRMREMELKMKEMEIRIKGE